MLENKKFKVSNSCISRADKLGHRVPIKLKIKLIRDLVTVHIFSPLLVMIDKYFWEFQSKQGEKYDYFAKSKAGNLRYPSAITSIIGLIRDCVTV